VSSSSLSNHLGQALVLGVVRLRKDGKILAGKGPLLPSLLRPGSPAGLCPLWHQHWHSLFLKVRQFINFKEILQDLITSHSPHLFHKSLKLL
jgi:hypothetical protein